MKAMFPHCATTRGVTIRVSVSFLPEQSEPAAARWVWAYHVRVENGGDEAIQLLTRHWIITDGRGRRHDIEGEGVVGEQPIIEPGDSFDYVSGCPLATPTGAMEGSYRMLTADGTTFEATIPRFSLVGPAVTG